MAVSAALALSRTNCHLAARIRRLHIGNLHHASLGGPQNKQDQLKTGLSSGRQDLNLRPLDPSWTLGEFYCPAIDLNSHWPGRSGSERLPRNRRIPTQLRPSRSAGGSRKDDTRTRDYHAGRPTAREMIRSKVRSEVCRRVNNSGRAPKPATCRVLGRRAVTALAITFAITDGGELRLALASERSEDATAAACAEKVRRPKSSRPYRRRCRPTRFRCRQVRSRRLRCRTV